MLWHATAESLTKVVNTALHQPPPCTYNSLILSELKLSMLKFCLQACDRRLQFILFCDTARLTLRETSLILKDK